MQLMSRRRELLLTLAVVLVTAGAISFYAIPRLSPVADDTASGGRALIGGPFTLTNHKGETVTEASFAGRHMLIYFGYSYCPDICPMSLQTMTAAYDLLSPEQQAEIEPIFITVDPERDTVDAMAEYVALFDPELIGLTGSPDQTDKAAKAYRVYHAKVEDDESAADYLVDHSSFYYFMGPDGQYLRHFGHDTTEEEMAKGIEELIE